MHRFFQLIREFRKKWGMRGERRRSADRAVQVACRMALNGCRM